MRWIPKNITKLIEPVYRKLLWLSTYKLSNSHIHLFIISCAILRDYNVKWFDQLMRFKSWFGDLTTLYIFSIILYILSIVIYNTSKVCMYVYLCMFIYTLYLGYICILFYRLYYLSKQSYPTLRKDIVHTICLNCVLNQMEYVKREGKTIPILTHTHT